LQLTRQWARVFCLINGAFSKFFGQAHLQLLAHAHPMRRLRLKAGVMDIGAVKLRFLVIGHAQMWTNP
jgi:hypothetical protein